MNNGFYGFPRGQSSVRPYLIGYKTVADSATIPLPDKVRNGDILMIAIGQRNGTYAAPNGWFTVLARDASGGEYNLIYMKLMKDDVSPVSIAYTGNQSAICFAFRGNGSLLLPTAMNWHTGTESAFALKGQPNGLYLAFAYDAASSIHVTGFTGLTTIGRIANGNASVCVAYRAVDGGINYGAYPATPAGALFDGYASLVLAP